MRENGNEESEIEGGENSEGVRVDEVMVGGFER